MNLVLDFALQRGRLALDVTLAVGAGETLALVGPNGAGKSTCLHAAAGLLGIERGRIMLGDRVLADAATGTSVPAEHRGIGFLFQEHRLFPHLCVLDNVAFGLRARGVARRPARAAARGWLERVGLGALADAMPRALSGGQAQRVALARALAPAPRVLLLDEPLSAVDATARQALRRELREHLAAFAGPRIVVTHDAVDAFTLADRIAVLEAGTVVQTGTPADIGSKPRSRYVADLVGLNCFHGRIAEGVFRIDSGAALFVVTEHEGPALATIHPRSIALFEVRPGGSPRNAWQAAVVALEPALDVVRVRLGSPLPVVAEVTWSAVEAMGLRVGTAVWAAVKATEIQVVAE